VERAKTEHARGLGKCFVQQSEARRPAPSNPAPRSTLQEPALAGKSRPGLGQKPATQTGLEQAMERL